MLKKTQAASLQFWLIRRLTLMRFCKHSIIHTDEYNNTKIQIYPPSVYLDIAAENELLIWFNKQLNIPYALPALIV